MMAWGMQRVNGFGDYFPEGEYLGWSEQLGQLFRNGLTEERKQELKKSMGPYGSWVAEAFYCEIGVYHGGALVVSPLDEELPKAYRTKKTYRTLGSLVEFPGHLLAVDEDLRDIIESLEPGVHRFWPIRIEGPKGVEYPRAYFGMIVGRFVDSFLPDKSDPASFKTGEPLIYQPKGRARDSFVGLAFDVNSIGSAHLWRERKLRNPPLCISDTLKARIDAAKLRVPKFRKTTVL